MSPRVLDAISYITRIVEDHWDQIVDPTEIHYELENQGFSTREISDAFRWIEQNTLGFVEEIDERRYAEVAAEFKLQQSLRILSPIEQAKIGTPGYGLLLSYCDRGLLEPVLLEEIIERAMQSESEELSLKDLRRIAALTIFNRAKADWQDLLPNSKRWVH